LRKIREINHAAEFLRKVDISDRNLYRTPRTPVFLLARIYLRNVRVPVNISSINGSRHTTSIAIHLQS